MSFVSLTLLIYYPSLNYAVLLTGAMCIIAAGSAAQLLVASLIVLFFMLLVLKLGPFEDEVDDWLSFLTNLQLLLTLLAGFALITKDSKASQMTPTQVSHLDSVLVAINSLALIALLLSIIGLHPKVRRWMEEHHSQHEKMTMDEDVASIKEASNKVHPTTGPADDDAEGLRNWKLDAESDANLATVE